MDELPQSDYEPPPEHATSNHTSPVDIGVPDLRVFWKQRIFEGQVCFFSISLQRLFPDGSWHDIYRVDTKHGVVHDHVFRADRPTQRHVCDVISADQGASYVDHVFDLHLSRVLDTWQTLLRRWSS